MPKATVSIRTFLHSPNGHRADQQPESMNFEVTFQLGDEPGEYAGSLQKAITQAAERAVTTLQTVEWFHDQNGKGEALCCPSCHPSHPHDWHPPEGHAGVEPVGFVPHYVLSPCPTFAAIEKAKDYDTALRLARDAAPGVTVNGWSAAEVAADFDAKETHA